MLKTNEKFPDFELKNQDGATKTLANYLGKWLVLYIYPKDDTPGCTIQGKSFTATKEKFDEIGINVVGLSADDVESHKNFCKKFSFTIDLLADPHAALLKELGVGQKEFNGTMYWNRTTFVVDPQGILRKIYTDVKPEGHEQILLKDIQELKTAKVGH